VSTEPVTITHLRTVRRVMTAADAAYQREQERADSYANQHALVGMLPLRAYALTTTARFTLTA
jgi:hypothetical protein